MTVDHAELLRELGRSHARLAGTLAGLTDEQAREPSQLPGWSRGHVATHLCRNADAIRRLALGVLSGVPAEMYPGRAGRPQRRDRGRRRPAGGVAGGRPRLRRFAGAGHPGTADRGRAGRAGQVAPADRRARAAGAAVAGGRDPPPRPRSRLHRGRLAAGVRRGHAGHRAARAARGGGRHRGARPAGPRGAGLAAGPADPAGPSGRSRPGRSERRPARTSRRPARTGSSSACRPWSVTCRARRPLREPRSDPVEEFEPRQQRSTQRAGQVVALLGPVDAVADQRPVARPDGDRQLVDRARPCSVSR